MNKIMQHLVMLLSVIGLLSACGGSEESSSSATSPPVSTSPPPVIPLPPPTQQDAARLLQQATFGPTLTDINYVVEQGLSVWLDDQMRLPASSHLARTRYYLETDPEAQRLNAEMPWRQHRVTAWHDIAVFAPDQLRQRVAFALSQLLVVSDQGPLEQTHAGLANYYDGLAEHAFGNYRDLLEYITLSPVMGVYLSMLGNEKPDVENNIRPDENFARELMQLFTIGLTELQLNGQPKRDSLGNTIPTYDLDTIKAYAHVFTGWHFNGVTSATWRNFWNHVDFLQPMTLVPEYHAIESEKLLLNGVIVPAGTSGEAALQLALDSLFQHPNVAPFISKHLIQHLVTSNPSPGYILRIAQIFEDNGQGERGDLAAVVKAILLDEEARLPASLQPDYYGKVKEPIVRGIQIYRALGLSAPEHISMQYPNYVFNQAPLSSPSVFNFFSPTYAPVGSIRDQGLVAPELEIITDNFLIRNSNFAAMWTIYAPTPQDAVSKDRRPMSIDFARFIPQLVDPAKFIDNMALLLLAGEMSSEMHNAILAYDALARTYIDDEKRAREIVYLITSSPQFAVQR